MGGLCRPTKEGANRLDFSLQKSMILLSSGWPHGIYNVRGKTCSGDKKNICKEDDLQSGCLHEYQRPIIRSDYLLVYLLLLLFSANATARREKSHAKDKTNQLELWYQKTAMPWHCPHSNPPNSFTYYIIKTIRDSIKLK